MDTLDGWLALFWFVMIVLFLLKIFEAAGRLFNYLRYCRERRIFYAAAQSGVNPDWAPIFIDEDGRVSIHPEDLVRTKQFARQISAVRRLEKEARKTYVPHPR